MDTEEQHVNGKSPELPPQPPTAPPTAATPDRYELTNDETGLLQGYNMRAIGVKARLWDLEDARRAAQAELESIQTQFNGALNGIAGAHGIAGGQLTPDFKSIVKGQPQ